MFRKSNHCYRVDTNTSGFNLRISPRKSDDDGCRWIKYMQITRNPAGDLTIDDEAGRTRSVRAYKENIAQKTRYAYLLRTRGSVVRIRLLADFDELDNANCDATYCSWTYNISFVGLVRTQRIINNGEKIFGRMPAPRYCDSSASPICGEAEIEFSSPTDDATVTIKIPVATVTGLTKPIIIEW